MIKNEILDFDKHYKLKLATNKELTKIKGYDFLNFLTDLMIKYSYTFITELEDER